MCDACGDVIGCSKFACVTDNRLCVKCKANYERYLVCPERFYVFWDCGIIKCTRKEFDEMTNLYKRIYCPVCSKQEPSDMRTLLLNFPTRLKLSLDHLAPKTPTHPSPPKLERDE